MLTDERKTKRLGSALKFLTRYAQEGDEVLDFIVTSDVPRNFFWWWWGVTTGIFFGGGGVQQIQLRTEGRENGDLGAVAPLVRGSTQFANE
jgi:hypothetical protein